jgi:hypothetical protein
MILAGKCFLLDQIYSTRLSYSTHCYKYAIIIKILIFEGCYVITNNRNDEYRFIINGLW